MKSLWHNLNERKVTACLPQRVLAVALFVGILWARQPYGFALEPSQEMARKLYAEKQDSIVWVTAVIKISMAASGSPDAPVNIPDQERTVDLLGTIVDPSGLVVVANSQLDPSRDLSNRRINTRNGPVDLEATVTLKELRVTMADGTEIPAEQVMKDQDLDLSFIRIKTDSKEAEGEVIKAIDLSDHATPGISDEVITLSRAGQVLSRAPTVGIGQVTCIVERPRRFICATGSERGCPTFTVDGKLVGVGVRRTVKGKGAALVVLPAEDVLEIARQASALGTDDKK